MRLLGLWLVVATTSPGAAAPDGAFRNLGTQITARTLQATAFTRLGDGSDVLCTIVRGQPCAKLIVADVKTGRRLASHDLPGANGGWAAVTASDGSVYLGTESSGKLFRYLPTEDRLIDAGSPDEKESYIWTLAAGPDGRIFCGTYPGCRLFQYRPEGGFAPMDGGSAFVPGESYLRALALAGDFLYVGVGNRTAHLVEMDLRNGGRREMLPETQGAGQTAYSVTVVGERLFVLLEPSRTTLVLNRKTGECEASFKTSGLYELTSSASPYDGKVYFVARDKLQRYDPATRHIETVDEVSIGAPFAFEWLDEGSPAVPWLMIFNQSGRLIKYHPPTGTVRAVPVDAPALPLPIQSLAAGPDGRIWMGGFLSVEAAAFDPVDGKTTQYRGMSQAESITSVGSKLYFGVYPHGRITEYDTAKPWNVAAGNPGEMVRLEKQSRPVAMVALPGGKQLVIGSVPEYGVVDGGALTVLDLATRAASTITDFVSKQSVVSLVQADGLVVGGTSIALNVGAPSADAEARLFVFDPASKAKVFEMVPVPGCRIVSGLVDRGDGSIWGMAEGILFGFDPRTRRITFTKEIFPPDPTGRISWRDATLLRHPNGKVYGVSRGRIFSIDPANLGVSFPSSPSLGGKPHGLTMDAAGRLYFADGTVLWQYDPAGQP